MAAPSSTLVYGGARAYVGVSNTTAAPYGGVEIGNVQSIVLEHEGVVDPLLRYDGTRATSIYRSEIWRVAFTVTDFDPDALAAGLGNVSDPGNGRALWVYPSTAPAPGEKMSQLTTALLIVPIDSTNQPALYLPNAEPLMPPQTISWGSSEFLEVDLAFEGLESSGGVVAKVGLLEDL